MLSAAAAALFLGSAHPASAQLLGGRSEIFAGSEFESYLRYLQTLGHSKPTVWSIRPLSPGQLDKIMPTDSAHPWAKRYDFNQSKVTGFWYEFMRPTTGFIANTSYPFGGNDGVIWAGKGLTAWAQAGVAARWGPLSLTFAPIAFRASNSEFELMDNGQSGVLRFGDGQFPTEIDRPQRFGASAYSRLDPGESTLRIDAAGVGAGISTASQWWGPTTEFSYILSNNAGGFPHVFLGTAKPANIGFGTVHGQVQYGYLYQSPFSPATGKDYFQSFEHAGKVRFMAGLVGVMTIRGAPGLEFGGGRFFHSATDSTGITWKNLRLPWENLLKSRLKAEDTVVFGDVRSLIQNQLASVYFRWAPPAKGMEIYGEYGREDFSADVRDFMLEPDHSSTFNLGFRKAWAKGARINAFRGEVFSYEAPSSGRTRGEGLIYVHQPLSQGHTYKGQLLGANVAVGSGMAYLFAFERFTDTGKLKIFTSRVTQHELPTRNNPQYSSGPALEKAVDVEHSIGAELSRFVGPFDVSGRVILTSDMNRYFLNDKSNANFALTVRQGF